MTISNILNISGLVFDLTGVIMLFKFGLPAEINRSGHHFILIEKDDKIEKARAKKYDSLSYVALCLITLGFLFQIAANIVPSLIK